MNLPTELREGLKISLAAIWANKLRSTLTTLGIIIGIVTVSLMATAIEGLNQAFLRSISALGSDVFYVEKFPWDSPMPWWKFRNRRDFDINDADDIARESKSALAVSVEASDSFPVKYENRSASSVWIVGNNEQSALVRQLTVKEGRFLSESEVGGARPVCVLGAEIAAKFFPRESPIGKRIRIANINFEIIGVLAKFGPFLFANMDSQIIIPITRYVSDFERRPYVLFMIKVRDARQMDEAREELRGALRKIRRVAPGADDDFSINQQETIVKSFHRVGGVIASVGLFITGLSLFVGGIGIMNIMFVSVAERTREIGIRKSLGARRKDILRQFLVEAATLSTLGAIIGIVLGLVAAKVIELNTPLPAAVAPWSLVAATLLGTVVGIVSGVYPARRASLLDPIEALRQE
jgi:putative ABC transport system permease protein